MRDVSSYSWKSSLSVLWANGVPGMCSSVWHMRRPLLSTLLHTQVSQPVCSIIYFSLSTFSWPNICFMPASTGLPLANILRRLVGTLGLAAATFWDGLGICILVSIYRVWLNLECKHQIFASADGISSVQEWLGSFSWREKCTVGTELYFTILVLCTSR